MNLYTVLLFVHMIGLTSLFGGVVLIQRSGIRLRRAATWEEARTWLALLRDVRGMFAGGSGMLLVTGLWMTHLQWTFATPWVVVPAVLLVLFAVAGSGVGRAFARLEEGAARRTGAIEGHERAIVSSPALWSLIFAMNFGALGIVWLMTTKPGWAVSIGVPLALTALGALVGRGVGGGRPRTEAARPLESGPGAAA